MEQPSPERCASLKAHKSLPRKRVVSDGSDRDSSPLNAKSRRSYTSPAKEAEINSWIRDASPPTPTNGSFLLPLTPPEENMAEDGREKEDDTGEAGEAAEPDPQHWNGGRKKKSATLSHHSRTISGSATPVNQHSPPTPDLTPPRKQRQRSPSPPLRKRNRISLSPPPASRQASSTAQSFRTAPDAGSPRLTSASVNTFHTVNEQRTPSDTRSPPRNVPENFGLGLGLMGEEMRTPTVEAPITMIVSSPSPSHARLDSGHVTPNMVRTDPLVAAEIPAVRELEQDGSYFDGIGEDDDLSFTGVSYIREDDTPYRERYSTGKASRHAGDKGLAESDLESRRSVSPLTDASGLDPLTLKARIDSKRFSQVSNLSVPQSVEVMVIDSSPPRQQRLRHSGKNPSLRAASSTHGDSNRSSLQSTSDVKPRLTNMLSRQAFPTTSSSLFSDSGISMAGSDHIMKRWNKMQHLDMPRRAPSSTRSLSYGLQHYISPLGPLRAVRQGGRPATAPHSDGIFIDKKRGESKTFSEASTLTREFENSRRGRHKVPPQVPKRSSSLSAPTGRESDSSGTQSSSPRNPPVSSQNTRAHNRSVSQPNPQPTTHPTIVVHAEPESIADPDSASPVTSRGGLSSIRSREPSMEQTPTLGTLLAEVKSNSTDGNSVRTPIWMRRSSDASDIRPLPNISTRTMTPRRSSKDDSVLASSRALLKTPFSGVSYQSSASGLYEVHEATAVNIYPHKNSSLLVIQQESPDGSMEFPVHPAVRPQVYRAAILPAHPAISENAAGESIHVRISAPDESLVNAHEIPVRRVDSPLSNPRPAPSPQKATHDPDEALPAVKLIPPTPLDGPGGVRVSTIKATLVSGPVALVRRALANRRAQDGTVARSSGLWFASGIGKSGNGSVVKRRKNRPVAGPDNNLSPFWRPRRFWEDSDEMESDEDEVGDDDAGNARRGQQFYQLGSKPKRAKQPQQSAASGNDYFGSLPIRNTLGFPQQRVVIPGPAALVRRLSSIRRRRTAVQAAWADPKLNPSLRSGSPKPPATLPQPGAGSSTNLASAAAAAAANPRASPSPSAMERRKKSNVGSRRKVRFEFHPMRGLTGGSGESKEWRTKNMVRRLRDTRDKRRNEKETEETERIEQRRRELRGLIGRPRLNAEGERI